MELGEEMEEATANERRRGQATLFPPPETNDMPSTMAKAAAAAAATFPFNVILLFLSFFATAAISFGKQEMGTIGGIVSLKLRWKS